MSERAAMRMALFMARGWTRTITSAEARARSHCLDCGLDTIEAGEFYMVRNDVWPVSPMAGMLCVGCLEERIGRRLRRDDFTSAPINAESGRRRSDRLKARQAA
jgi:hypothetical protein